MFRFPHPTGRHGIGTLTYHWVDADRPEAFTADPDDRRELMVQLWYPATPDPAAPHAPCVRDADALAPALTPLPELTPQQLSDVTTNAVESAPVADDQLSYPVLLFLVSLGAGAHVVRLSGKLYEALKALVEHRPRLDLYHSALQIRLPDDRFVIECAAILNLRGEERGVVAGGPVGMSWLGRFRHFRYEICRWRGGSISDLAHAVSGPVRVATDIVRAQRVLDLAPSVPIPVWGRDELRTGEMWNSNSLISWLLARAGIDTDGLEPPVGGRAPGWNAGLVVAGRQMQHRTP